MRISGTRMTDLTAGRDPMRGRGFTLIELMVTLVVLVVLITIAAPSFSELTASQRTQTAATDIFSSLLRARSEAIKQNADVTIAPSGTWPEGWTVSSAAGDIEKHGATANVAISGAPASVVYRSNGRISGTTTPKFSISATNTATKRCVQVNLSGQPVVTKAACS
jgi:type IV fimbrial biogenesis protein FimT